MRPPTLTFGPAPLPAALLARLLLLALRCLGVLSPALGVTVWSGANGASAVVMAASIGLVDALFRSFVPVPSVRTVTSGDAGRQVSQGADALDVIPWRDVCAITMRRHNRQSAIFVHVRRAGSLEVLTCVDALSRADTERFVGTCAQRASEAAPTAPAARLASLSDAKVRAPFVARALSDLGLALVGSSIALALSSRASWIWIALAASLAYPLISAALTCALTLPLRVREFIREGEAWRCRAGEHVSAATRRSKPRASLLPWLAARASHGGERGYR